MDVLGTTFHLWGAQMANRDRWPELCELVRKDDGLPTRECGLWTADKLYFWHKYVEITTRAMADKPAWGGLAYVDLFAGPGICEVRDTGERLPGSPIIAANASKPFNRILLVELDASMAHACETRMRRSPAHNRFRVFAADCNRVVSELVAEIPSRALTLAFVDPEGFDIRFDTLEELAQSRRVDFLMLFADRMDLVRNVETYANQSASKVDLALGPESRWRERWANLQNRSAENVSRLFSELFQEQMERLLGYEGFRQKTIKSGRGPLYTLIYASKSERGLDFWDKVVRRDRGGQPDLF